MSATTLFDVSLARISGEPITLQEFRGKVLLIVNVASKCGLTGQYEGLEKLYNTYKHSGFVVLGFPANDFAGQEPGSNQEIQKFCTDTYGASFPMFEKIVATGPEKHELYQFLTAVPPVAQVNDPGFRTQLDGFLSKNGGRTNPLPDLLWNFEKFLIDREGHVVARFAPDMLPGDPRVIRAIEAALQPLHGDAPNNI